MPMPTVIPMVSFARPKPGGHGTLYIADSAFLGAPVEPRPSTQEPSADPRSSLGSFPRGTLQEASDHAPQFITYTGGTYLAILPTGIHSNPTPLSLSLPRPRQARTRGVLQLLLYVCFCGVHHSPALPESHSVQYMSTRLWPRSAMPRPPYSASLRSHVAAQRRLHWGETST